MWWRGGTGRGPTAKRGEAKMTRRATLTVDGMTCNSCERHVADALERAGAEQVTANWRAGQASFAWPDGVAEQDLRAAVSATGYRPGTLAEIPESQSHASVPASASA